MRTIPGPVGRAALEGSWSSNTTMPSFSDKDAIKYRYDNTPDVMTERLVLIEPFDSFPGLHIAF